MQVQAALADGTVGDPYVGSVFADGLGPIAYQISAGAPPDGVALDSTLGSLTGTPTAAGAFTFTITATDASTPAVTASTEVTITIAPAAPLALSAATLPDAQVSLDYATGLAAVGGSAPVNYTVTAGTTPPGISLDPSGALTGLPTTTGTYTFTVTATDANANNQSADFSLTVNPLSQLTIDAPVPPPGVQGTPFTWTPSAVGGTQPVNWSLTTGTLQAGLTLDPNTGTISGIPTTAGTSDVTLTATDSATPTPLTGQITATLVIYPVAPPTIASQDPSQATVGTPFDLALIATGGLAPLTWTVTGGTLPPGLSLDPNAGTISGTPTSPGWTTATITVSDSSTPPQTDSRTVEILVVPAARAAGTPPTLTQDTPPTAWALRNPFSYTFAATGDPAPTFTVASGTLPPGLTLDPASGLLSGTPTKTGTFSFTVTAENGIDPADTSPALTLQIGRAPEMVGLLPSQGRVGAFVVVLGDHLSTTTSVSFNGTPARILRVTNEWVMVTVPAGATTGKVTLKTLYGSVSSRRAFTVLARSGQT
jgi:hypothetical protein